MIGKIEELLRRVEEFRPKTAAEVEEFRIKVLGKKGELNALMEEFKRVAPELKREVGQRLNALKQAATERVAALRAELQESRADDAEAIGDPTRPGSAEQLGSRHPISLVKNQIVEIFSRLGYTVADGPEIEDDWHVFSALNFPPEHPARDMQDTFFIEKNPDILLRTQTSGVQVHVMENKKPPIYMICPGTVFRPDTADANHLPQFTQVEGLVVDEGITFGDLKGTLDYFTREIFGKDRATRYRPHFFPFTEPSCEVDVSCGVCGGKGCRFCKNTGWLEILGAGMVDPNVFGFCGIDPEKYTGFAFGIGVERVAALRYDLPDLRTLMTGDMRFLEQF